MDVVIRDFLIGLTFLSEYLAIYIFKDVKKPVFFNSLCSQVMKIKPLHAQITTIRNQSWIFKSFSGGPDRGAPEVVQIGAPYINL